MTKQLDRRGFVKATGAVGGLLVLGNGVTTAAAEGDTHKLAGEWLMAGNNDLPCAIFQQGRVLLIVNENGDLATGRVTGRNKLVALKGTGWEPDLEGVLSQDGKTINWENGTMWKRR
jgi:hypothetical protein